MGIWYVKRMDSQDEISMIKRICFIPKIKQVENYYIVTLPVKKGKELNIKMQERIGKTISKNIFESQNQNLVLASDLKLETLKNTLYANNFNILDGTWIFKFLLPQIINYICETKQIDSRDIEVSIMINNNSENIMKMLIEIAQNIKMLNIVTDDIDRFKSMEEYLFTNMGIVIRTTNNKKKGLLKSNLIINYDFSENLLNSYVIPKNGIIINISESIKIKSKRFSGINCNSYSIILPKEKIEWFNKNGLLNDFDKNELFESLLYYKKSYESIEKELNESKVEYLIGNNGKIREEEYKNLE